MPKADLRGTRLHYEDAGTGQQTLVMSHGLLFSTRMFDAQVAAFKDRYRCMTTSADPEPAENLPKYGRLVTAAWLLGLRLIAGRVMPIMFGRMFMGDPGRVDERRRWQQFMGRNNKWGVIRATQGVLTRAHLVTIPRAGHSSPIEEPAAVNRALADFMDGVPR